MRLWSDLFWARMRRLLKWPQKWRLIKIWSSYRWGQCQVSAANDFHTERPVFKSSLQMLSRGLSIRSKLMRHVWVIFTAFSILSWSATVLHIELLHTGSFKPHLFIEGKCSSHIDGPSLSTGLVVKLVMSHNEDCHLCSTVWMVVILGLSEHKTDEGVGMQEKTNYKSILYKTYFVMEYAASHYNVRFVLKTDDDAFINVQPLIQQLKLLCKHPDCQNERIYMVSTFR